MVESRHWKEADEIYQAAVETSTDPQVLALLFRSWGTTYQLRNNWTESERCFRQALDIVRRQVQMS